MARLEPLTTIPHSQVAVNQSTTRKLPSLVICIIMDLIGYATYSIPFFGEFLDLAWAPISGFIFWTMFGGWKGAMGGVFAFLEEFLPGTDFIPSFSLMWGIRYFQNRKVERLNEIPA